MARKGKKWQSPSDKAQYAGYNSRYTKNRERRLVRHCKNHPEDKAAEETLMNSKFPYRRKRPRGKVIELPVISEAKQLVRAEMLKREVKAIKKQPPEYIKMLITLRNILKPKVRNRKRRGKNQRVPQAS